jgi:hypothetical protein
MQWSVSPPTADLGQPSCWQRLPPPCALQWPVSPNSPLGAALLLTPFAPAMRHTARCAASSSCLGAVLLLAPLAAPVRSALQWPVSPTADLVQPFSWHRLPPPCATQHGVPPPAADLVQPFSWHRLPPPCTLQYGVPPLSARLEQPSSSHCRLPMALLRGHSATRRPQHDGGPDSLECSGCSERAGVISGWGKSQFLRELPSCVITRFKSTRRLGSSAGGRHGSARRASLYTHRYRCGSCSLSQALCTPPERRKPWKHGRIRHPLVGADASHSAARQIAGVIGPACRIQSNSHEPTTPLSVVERCDPAGCPAPRDGQEGSLRIEWYTSQWYVRVGSWQRHPAVLRVRSPPPHTRQGSLPVLHILSTAVASPWSVCSSGG